MHVGERERSCVCCTNLCGNFFSVTIACVTGLFGDSRAKQKAGAKLAEPGPGFPSARFAHSLTVSFFSFHGLSATRRSVNRLAKMQSKILLVYVEEKIYSDKNVNTKFKSKQGCGRALCRYVTALIHLFRGGVFSGK